MKQISASVPIKNKADKIKHISLTTLEFLSLMKSLSCENIELKLPESNGKHNILESINDIEENLPLLKLPMTITVEDQTFRFSAEGVEFNYGESDNNIRQKIIGEFELYVQWYSILFRWYTVWIAFFVAVSPFIADYFGFDKIIIDLLSSNKIVKVLHLSSFVILVLNAPIFTRSRIYHRKGESYFSRNRDAIITGTIMLIIGSVITFIVGKIID